MSNSRHIRLLRYVRALKKSRFSAIPTALLPALAVGKHTSTKYQSLPCAGFFMPGIKTVIYIYRNSLDLISKLSIFIVALKML